MNAPTRPIRTSTQQTTCDVCGRTLLRGERAEVYLAGSSRHSVCELCTARALHGGWVREGTVPAVPDPSSRVDRRRSLLRRRRSRRVADVGATEAELSGPPMDFGDGALAPDDASELVAPVRPEPAPPPAGSAPEWPDAPSRPERRPRRRRLLSSALRPEPAPPRGRAAGREPRHVRAVPTSIEHKIEAAIELFNGSEHPRTVAGIARSLGLPDVAVHPADPVATVVEVVVSWELCWYRYEVDLSDEVLHVRVAGQGYELSELSALDLQINAVADEHGRLAMAPPGP